MMRFVMSAKGYRLYPEVAAATALTLSESFLQQVVIIDAESLELQARQIPSPMSVLPMVRISMSAWLKGGVPDVSIIRRTAQSLPSNTLLLLDSAEVPHHTISALLSACSSAWFHVEEWPRAVALVCDDLVMHRFAKELAGLFYIPAESLLNRDLQVKVQHLQDKAKLLRWLGYGRTTHALSKLMRLGQRLMRVLLS